MPSRSGSGIPAGVNVGRVHQGRSPRTASESVVGSMVAGLLVACGNSPSYRLPGPPPLHTAPTVTASVPCQTLALGLYSDELCVLGAVFGSASSYGALPNAADMSQIVPGTVIEGGSPTGCATDPGGSPNMGASDIAESTAVSLFVDAAGEWQLTANALEVSAFTALVQCVPWGNFGLAAAPAFRTVQAAATACVPASASATCYVLQSTNTTTGEVNYDGVCGPTPDGCGGYVDCGPCLGPGDVQTAVVDAGPSWQETTPLPVGSACLLSSVSGDFAEGGAELVDGGLFAADPPQNGITAENLQVSAMCFPGLLFADVPLAAPQGIGSVPLPAGLCGLSLLSAMTSPDSSASVTGSVGSILNAEATARCLLYPTAASQP